MISFVSVPIFYLGNIVAKDLRLASSNLLVLCLEISFMMETFGRTQREEIVKNAFSLHRWLYIIPSLSIVLLFFSGVYALCFYLLVFTLRFLFDTCRGIFRVIYKDETVKHSSNIRNIVHFFAGLCSLVPALVLSVSVSYASLRGPDTLVFCSSFLLCLVGYSYYALASI